MLSPLEMRAAYETIRKDFCIELTWVEKVALSYYITSFGELAKIGHPINPYAEAITRFMIDYFGLDRYELRVTTVRTFQNGRVQMRQVGSDFIDNPDGKFQEYCRRKVNEWRAERESI